MLNLLLSVSDTLRRCPLSAVNTGLKEAKNEQNL
jgi:hypothetical protein